MGAWGMGFFDDDVSCDLLYDAMECNAEIIVKKALAHKDSEYLEYDECHEVIVSGSILDSLLNGTKYSHNTKGFDEWLAKQDITGLSELRESV